MGIFFYLFFWSNKLHLYGSEFHLYENSNSVYKLDLLWWRGLLLKERCTKLYGSKKELEKTATFILQTVLSV